MEKVRRAKLERTFINSVFGTENLETVSQHSTSLDGINYLLYISINNFFPIYENCTPNANPFVCFFTILLQIYE